MVDTPARFLQRLMDKEFFIPDQWCAQEVYQVMRRNPTWIYTEGVPREKLERYHFRCVDSVEKGVAELLARFGEKARAGRSSRTDRCSSSAPAAAPLRTQMK